MRSNRGQAIITVIIILLVFLGAIPTLVYLMRGESVATTKQKRATTAFHAADAGVDQAIWKLRELPANWETIIGAKGSNGGTLAGYCGDSASTYKMLEATSTTKAAGEYRISIEKVDGETVRVLSKGRDPSQKEVRAIEVLLTKKVIVGPLQVSGNLEYMDQMEVHWGPVVCYNDIINVSRRFPQKYSRGRILPVYDGQGTQYGDDDPTPPNTDGREYWAFYDVGKADMDLAGYLNDAKASTVPLVITTGTNTGHIYKKGTKILAVPHQPNSGYFPAELNNGGIEFEGGYVLSDPRVTIYTDGTADLSSQVFLHVKALIIRGSCNFNAKGITIPNVPIPSMAPKQYLNERPTYTWPGKNSTTGKTDLPFIGLHGLLYVGDSMSMNDKSKGQTNANGASGNSALLGLVRVDGNMQQNSFIIYYDEAVAQEIKFLDRPFRQISWRELRTAW